MTKLIVPDMPEDPSALLEALGGLKVDYFHTAIRAGEAERRTCTRDDPNNAGGSKDYFARVRVLREVLREKKGWKRHDLNQLPLVINPEKTIAIGVVPGDHKTGFPWPAQPKSRRPVGDVKMELVAQNSQPTLFDLPRNPEEVTLEPHEAERMSTWMLVTYRRNSRGKVIVSSELSKPVELDKQNYVIRWAPRIPLPPLEFEPVIDYIEGTDDGPTEFDVPVEDH